MLWEQGVAGSNPATSTDESQAFTVFIVSAFLFEMQSRYNFESNSQCHLRVLLARIFCFQCGLQTLDDPLNPIYIAGSRGLSFSSLMRRRTLHSS